MNMNLIIDIGNTRTKLFLFAEDSDQLLTHKVTDGCTLSDVEEWLASKQTAFGHKLSAAIVSTTADLPAEAQARIDALPCPVLRFGSDTPIPIANHYGTPATLGTDRLAAAIGAWSRHPGCPLLIVDAGSCITIDFVSAQGAYEGGNISPGLHMRLQAMHEHTSRLPLIEAEGEIPTLGYDTETALRAGVNNGIRLEIEGYIRLFLAKYPDLFVFLTGGDGISLDEWTESCTFADQFLVARGLNHILNHNKHLAKLK